MAKAITINRPEGLADFGYSAQAACIGSALTQHEYAKAYRQNLRAMLDRLETPTSDTDFGKEFEKRTQRRARSSNAKPKGKR